MGVISDALAHASSQYAQIKKLQTELAEAKARLGETNVMTPYDKYLLTKLPWLHWEEEKLVMSQLGVKDGLRPALVQELRKYQVLSHAIIVTLHLRLVTHEGLFSITSHTEQAKGRGCHECGWHMKDSDDFYVCTASPSQFYAYTQAKVDTPPPSWCPVLGDITKNPEWLRLAQEIALPHPRTFQESQS